MVVIALISYQDKILIGKKKSSSKKFLKGKWHIPGETVQQGESDKDALIRGMKEETGLEIRIGKYIDSHITPSSKKEARWYECFSNTDDVTPGSDIEFLKWVHREEVMKCCSRLAYSLWPKKVIDYLS